MFALTRRTITALAVSLGLSAMTGLAASPAGAHEKTFAQDLRAGGLVIVVRHGATFADQADTDPLNFDNIAAQRNLNAKGKALAKAFGDAIRQAGFPSARSIRASTIELTRPPSSQASRISRRQLTSPRAVSSFPRTKTAAASRPSTRCSARRQSRA